MSQEAISLNYPVNLNHRSLQPDQREAFLQEDLNTMVESIDLETPVLNAVYRNGAEGLPRTDKFVELQGKLKRSGTKFVTLEAVEITHLSESI